MQLSRMISAVDLHACGEPMFLYFYRKVNDVPLQIIQAGEEVLRVQAQELCREEILSEATRELSVPVLRHRGIS